MAHLDNNFCNCNNYFINMHWSTPYLHVICTKKNISIQVLIKTGINYAHFLNMIGG